MTSTDIAKRENEGEKPLPFWLLPFRRVTSGRPVLSCIDGLRFVAILSVVLFHIRLDTFQYYSTQNTVSSLDRWIASLMECGAFGVPIFFAISGFILFSPFLGDSESFSIRRFYLRRLTRLEPPYFINITVCLLIAAHHFGKPLSTMLPEYLSTITYTHGFIYGTTNLINGVTWSLELEIQFYLLLPLFAPWLARLRTPTRRFVFLAIIATGCLFRVTLPQSFQWTLLPWVSSFFVGILFADLWISGWIKARKSYVLDLACAVAVIAWAALYPRGNDLEAWRLWAWVSPLAIAGIMAAALRGVMVNWLLSRPFIWVTGGMCYTIYLWHIFWAVPYNRIHGLGVHWGYAGYFLVHLAIILPLLWTACAALFYCFEKPFMRRDWPKRTWQRLAGHPPSASPSA